MIRLGLYAAALWAAYRMGEATALGVPVLDALLNPLAPVKSLAQSAPVLRLA